jgi:hypothetical protein
MGSILAATFKTAQKQTAREKSRAGLGGLIAVESPESRQTGAKTGQKQGFGAKMANGE